MDPTRPFLRDYTCRATFNHTMTSWLTARNILCEETRNKHSACSKTGGHGQAGGFLFCGAWTAGKATLATLLWTVYSKTPNACSTMRQYALPFLSPLCYATDQLRATNTVTAYYDMVWRLESSTLLREKTSYLSECVPEFRSSEMWRCITCQTTGILDCIAATAQELSKGSLCMTLVLTPKRINVLSSQNKGNFIVCVGWIYSHVLYL